MWNGKLGGGEIGDWGWGMGDRGVGGVILCCVVAWVRVVEGRAEVGMLMALGNGEGGELGRFLFLSALVIRNLLKKKTGN